MSSSLYLGALAPALALAAWPLCGQVIDRFNPSANGRVTVFAVQSDGKVLIGGDFTTIAGQPRERLARFHPDGTLDESFNPGANQIVLALSVNDHQQTITIGGGFTSLGGQPRNFIGRVSFDGTLDPNFNPGANHWVRDLVAVQDGTGRIVVAGQFTTLAGEPRNHLGRLDYYGTLDAGFNPNASGQVNTIALSFDGKIVVGGFFTNLAGHARNGLARLHPDGGLDTGFNPDVNGPVLKAVTDFNGVTFGGSFSAVGGQARSNLARVGPNGVVDPAFSPGANGIVETVARRGVDEFVLGGHFTILGGQTRAYLGGIKANGTLDGGFTNTANAPVIALAVQPGGRLLVGGDFSYLGRQDRSRVARLHFGPANDDRVDASPLIGTEHFAFGDNANASREFGERWHADVLGQNSVWWRWVSPINGPVTIDTTGSSFKTILAVYQGDSHDDWAIAWNYDNQTSGPGRSRVFFNARAGDTYHVAVDGPAQNDAFAPAGMYVLYLRAGTLTGNDAFANAYNFPSGATSVTGDNLNATRESREPDHVFSQTGRSVWWRWTAPSSGTVYLDTAGSSIVPRLAVYLGDNVDYLSLNLVAHHAGVYESVVTFQAVAGQNYKIAVDADDGGQIVLNFRQRPPNDNFENRLPLAGVSLTALGQNRFATRQDTEPIHGSLFEDKSVWWTWTAPTSAMYTLDAIGSSYNPVLAVYTSNVLARLTLVANSDGFLHTANRLTFAAVQNATYQFVAEGSQYRVGDIVLNLRPTQPPPPNNLFADSLPIPQWPATIHGSNLGADTETGESPGNASHTVWWHWVMPTNGSVRIVRRHAVPGLRMSVQRGTSISQLTPVADTLYSNICILNVPVRSLDTYYLSVGSSEADQGDFQLDIEFIPAPKNDHFADSIVIDPQTETIQGTTMGASTQPGEPFANASVWWSFTPETAGPFFLTTAGSAIDTSLGVYTGSAVNALTLLGRNDDTYLGPVITGPVFDQLSRLKIEGLAGQTYHIQLGKSRGAEGPVVLNLPKVAIEEITPGLATLLPDRHIDFSASLKLTNVKTNSTGPLRIRLLARTGHSHLETLLHDCGQTPSTTTAPDLDLGVIELPLPGHVPARDFRTIAVSGRCPPPYEAGNWGYGWGVIAILEELLDGWEIRDSRLLLHGNWPRVNGFLGPGGGVVTVASGTGQVLPSFGFIDVTIGPPAAVRLGGRWRVSPTNFGTLHQFTNFTSQALTLQTRSLNFSIEVTNLPGFMAPTNRPVQLQPGVHLPLNLRYAVNPPRLFYNRATGLSITGTVGTAYRIEGTSRVNAPFPWPSNAGRTLTAGQNQIPNTAPIAGTNRFYRAFWLSD